MTYKRTPAEAYAFRIYWTAIWRVGRIPQKNARLAAARRLLARLAGNGQPLKQILNAALEIFDDEEGLRRFVVSLAARIKKKRYGGRQGLNHFRLRGKSLLIHRPGLLFDRVDNAILAFWDGFGIAKSVRDLGNLPPLSRWSGPAASAFLRCLLQRYNDGVSPKTYLMRLRRLNLKPQKPALIIKVPGRASFSVGFSSEGAKWWREKFYKKQSKKC